MTNKKFKEILIKEIEFQTDKKNIEKVISLDYLLMLYCKDFQDYINETKKIKNRKQYIEISINYICQ